MILLWAAVLIFLAAAGRDLGWRLIDHRLVFSLILLWGAHAVLSGWGAATVVAHLQVAGLAFAVTLIFYRLGWMGGGDVKLAVPVFLWAGPDNAVGVLVLVTVAGAVLALLGLAARALLRLPVPSWAGRGLGLISTEHGVPYGVALALGGAAAALSSTALPSGG